jgi:hypothetical protein
MAACRHAGVMNGYEQVPKPVSLTQIPVGDVLRVKMPAGIHTGDVGEGCETLAAALGAREVRVVKDRGNAAYADVTVVRENPFAGGPPLVWPLLDAPAVSLWKPIPIGKAEDGSEATISLPGRNLMLGGEPEGGKSVALQQIIAAAALHPGVHLTLFDAKRVELTSWRGCADRFVGPDVNDGIAALEELREDMDRRYEWLESVHRRQIRQGDPFGLRVVGIDELALFTARGEKKACAQFSTLAEDLGGPGQGGGHHRRGRHAEAEPRHRADLAAGSVRLPLGDAVLHAAGLRHDPRPGLGLAGLLRHEHRRCGAGRGVPAARGRPADPPALVLPR